MKKKDFLNNYDVKTFINFIAKKWHDELDFNVGIKHKGRSVKYIYSKNLEEILNTYSWQYSIVTKLEIPVEIPRKGDSLAQSEKVLNFAQSMLIVNGKINDNPNDLRIATEITLKWGGVFTKGNKDKAINVSYDLKKDFEEVLTKWKDINQNDAIFTPTDNFEFTSNAGFTKVYSLLLPDFVIYDSRVSVALAYLMEQCFVDKIPEFLRIYIPASKVTDQTKRQVNNFFTSTHQKDSKHFYSNVISSILLKESLKLINENDSSVKLRDLEASLFMMGYDVRVNELKMNTP